MSAVTSDAAVLDHVGVAVPDLGEAVDFFCTLFGAEVVFAMERQVDPTGIAPTRLGAHAGASFALAMLQLGGGRLELLQWWGADDEPVAARRDEPYRALHVAITVDVAATLERVRQDARVRVLGEPVTFESGPTPGMTNAFITTPWGMLVELISWGKS